MYEEGAWHMLRVDGGEPWGLQSSFGVMRMRDERST